MEALLFGSAILAAALSILLLLKSLQKRRATNQGLEDLAWIKTELARANDLLSSESRDDIETGVDILIALSHRQRRPELVERLRMLEEASDGDMARRIRTKREMIQAPRPAGLRR